MHEKNGTGDVPHWKRFFAAWKRLPPYPFSPHAPGDTPSGAVSGRAASGMAPVAPPVDLAAAAEFFQALGQQLDCHHKSGGGIDIWQVAGIGSDEVKNCAVLAWLLDCHGSHGQGSLFFRALVECLHAAAHRHNFDPSCLPCAADVCRGYAVQREYAYYDPACEHAVRNGAVPQKDALPQGGILPSENTPSQKTDRPGGFFPEFAADGNAAVSSYRRVDIRLSGANFLLFIEAKVYSGENGDQLTSYHRHLQRVGNGKKQSLVYLTRTGCLPQNTSLHGAVLPLRWRDLACALAACARREMPPGSLGHVLVEQFCGHLRFF